MFSIKFISMYTFRIGFGPSGNHYRDGKTWNVFRSVAHHTWARWMDIQWRQINHLRCLHSCDVQGGWDICSFHGVDSGHRVHSKCSSRCMPTHFMLSFCFSLGTFLLVVFSWHDQVSPALFDSALSGSDSGCIYAQDFWGQPSQASKLVQHGVR